MAAIKEASSNEKNHYERLGYPDRYDYFNSGVMLINLDYWREHAAIKLFEHFISQVNTKLAYHDQDILNAVFYDNKIIISVRYNLESDYLYKWTKLDKLIDFEDFHEAVRDPVIVHFSGAKPWLRWYNLTDIHPYASTFYKYQQQTIWKDWPIEDWRPRAMRLRHFVADTLRKLKLKSPIPKVFIDLPPID